MKNCSKCRIEKPLDEFHADKNAKDGKRSYCKKCVKNSPKAPLKRQSITCPRCQQIRSITKYQAKRRKTDYCSNCITPATQGGIRRPDHTGNNSPRWKGGSYISTGGYRMVKCDGEYSPSGRQVYRPEHVIVMEQYLERKIKTEQNGGGESIHHINGDKLNNDIDNLVLCQSSKEHRLLHASLEEIAFEFVRDGIIKFNQKTKKYYRADI